MICHKIKTKIKSEGPLTRVALGGLMIAGVFLITAPLSAWAMHLGDMTNGHPTGQYVAEDVRNTLHNLGDVIYDFDNPNIDASGSSTREVCVFCHTPHGANTSVPAGSPPLWNRQVNTTGYTPYASPNFDTPSLGQPQGVSLACLSCHDGTIALDALVNAGGSGGFRGFTPASADLVNPQGSSALIDAGGSMTEGSDRTDTGPNYDVIAGSASPFPNLTPNLTDDHPISMHIPSTGGGCQGFTPGAAGVDPQFNDLCAESTVVAGNVLLLRRSGTDGPADRRDHIRAYPDPDDNNIGSNTYVECASCHNPHTPRPLFLRLPSAEGVGGSIDGNSDIPNVWGGTGAEVWGDNPNFGSAICLSCHEK
jgi:cytochrome c553